MANGTGETSGEGAPPRAVWRRPGARSVIYAYALTRLLVLTVLVVGGQINLVMEGTGLSTRDMHLSVGKIPVARVLRDTLKTADVNWYHGIAVDGYERRRFDASTPHNWAFFPAFPAVWRAASLLTGETMVTGLVLSNVLFIFALALVYKSARAFGLDHAGADRTVFYLAAFPVSYFFSLPMTESLFLLLTAGSFYAAKRGAWWAAALLGALASATRVTGVLLLPALLLLHFQAYGRGFWRRPSLLWLGLVPAGLASFMYFLHVTTGNALAFMDVLAAWGRRPGFFLLTLWEYLRQPQLVAVPWDFRLLNFLAPTGALLCGVVLLRRREWALAAYTLLAVVAALSSSVLQSQARYAMVVFPAFFVLADLAGPRPRLDLTLRALSFALLGLLTALFAGHFSMAMA